MTTSAGHQTPLASRNPDSKLKFYCHHELQPFKCPERVFEVPIPGKSSMNTSSHCPAGGFVMEKKRTRNQREKLMMHSATGRPQ